ncbi:MAG: VWA domain-containing protein [Oscillospiraceae bacterium]|nr:VWA domain-containing protein [Oscillospiraceae bacterium]
MTPYPFTAIVGQERLKLALILNLVDPAVGGVLISGEKGTAKSTAVRAIAALSGRKTVEVPLNVTEDRLVGTLDITNAVNSGEKCFEKGLLYEADGNFLYVDEINLLGTHISGILAEVIASQENIVSRDGIEYRHPCRCIPIGTMNPEEGTLRPQLLDKFGLFVNVSGEEDIELRTEVIRRRLEYELDPESFCARFRPQEEKLARQIIDAKKRLERLSISEKILRLCALAANSALCEGNRCEIILAETAKALCAWRNGAEVTADDVSEAAKFVLPHRMRNAPQEETVQQNTETSDKNEPPENTEDNSQTETEPPQDTALQEENSAEQNEKAEAAGDELPLSAEGIKSAAGKNGGSGKRSKTIANENSGRYVRSTVPHGKCTDIAVIPTLCNAALNQRWRTPENGMKLSVRPSDIRKKIREKRTGATILFAVDASGSMGTKRRMRAVKGAVKGLLSEAYRKRDRVGVVAFRGNGAQTLLNITGSPELARKCMDELPTGGKTPLAAGIAAACELLRAERIRTPDALQYLIFISDGKANVPLRSDDPFGDALTAAEQVRLSGVGAMVLDTENSYIRFGYAKQIAERMDAQYISLDEVTGSAVEENVREFINNE